jgi:lycopene cyclase domain-containing protein
MSPSYQDGRDYSLGIGITAKAFIIWDAMFTWMDVWGFNARYLTGMEVLYLPVEEIMFFSTIPYVCLFTYETPTGGGLFRKDRSGCL